MMHFILLSSLLVATAQANIIPFETSATVASTIVTEKATSCDDTTFNATKCVCAEETVLGVRFAALDCGFCTACNTDESLCIRKQTREMRVLDGQTTDIARINDQTYSVFRSDGTDIVFEWLEVDYTGDRLDGLEEFTLDGTSCTASTVAIDANTTSCPIDCTNIPGIDTVVDLCYQSNAADQDPFVYFTTDTDGFNSLCVDAQRDPPSSGDDNCGTFQGGLFCRLTCGIVQGPFF